MQLLIALDNASLDQWLLGAIRRTMSQWGRGLPLEVEPYL